MSVNLMSFREPWNAAHNNKPAFGRISFVDWHKHSLKELMVVYFLKMKLEILYDNILTKIMELFYGWKMP